MDFLKRLLGGGKAQGPGGDPDGLYFYVKPYGCDEVVKFRVHRYNDLSAHDEGDRMFARKGVRGSVCTRTVEVELYFDKKYNLVDSTLQGGELVTETDYLVWLASQSPSETASTE